MRAGRESDTRDQRITRKLLGSLNVRLAPRATELLRHRELSQGPGRERIQKDRFAAVSPNCDQVFDQAVFARVAEL
jgi:hypothetical protein